MLQLVIKIMKNFKSKLSNQKIKITNLNQAVLIGLNVNQTKKRIMRKNLKRLVRNHMKAAENITKKIIIKQKVRTKKKVNLKN